MNILLIGNLCSGKTTLAKALIKQGLFKEEDYHAIDDYRRKYSDGTVNGEYYAVDKFLSSIGEEYESRIYEFSGTGRNCGRILDLMRVRARNWLIIYVEAEYETLLERNKSRTLDIPFPYKFNGIGSSLTYMETELEKKKRYNFWNQNYHIIDTKKRL